MQEVFERQINKCKILPPENIEGKKVWDLQSGGIAGDLFETVCQ